MASWRVFRPRSQRTRAGNTSTANSVVRCAIWPISWSKKLCISRLRSWIEQSYKQVKNSLGWAHYQVRKDLSIRRHWQLVCCAFSFCWWACEECVRGVQQSGLATDGGPQRPEALLFLHGRGAVRGEKEEQNEAASVMAAGSEKGALVASALRNAPAILAGIYRSAPAQRVTEAA